MSDLDELNDLFDQERQDEIAHDSEQDMSDEIEAEIAMFEAIRDAEPPERE